MLFMDVYGGCFSSFSLCFLFFFCTDRLVFSLVRRAPFRLQEASMVASQVTPALREALKKHLGPKGVLMVRQFSPNLKIHVPDFASSCKY